MKVDFRAAPFHLNSERLQWVERTLQEMSLEEKIGQLFCPSISFFTPDAVEHLPKLHIGSLMLRPFDVAGLQENVRSLQDKSRIPMLIAANLENGGCGAIVQGTNFAMPMGCAAAGGAVHAYRLGKVSCREAASVGVNWGFAPIVDIDNNYRNPITNIRAFSSHPDEVLALAQAYIRAAGEEGVAPTIKHFPGDGCDERDQHLLVSVNDLSYEQWMASYGMIYQELIREGAPAVMVGHIAQPSVARRLDPELSDKDALLPASQSRTLLTGLLRETLNFNGLVITDSTLMVGYMQSMPRRRAIPLTIQSGADMILFNRVIDEDIAYLKDGLANGLVTKERIDEAAARVLAFKAMLGLPEKATRDELVPHCDPMELIGSELTRRWVDECAERAVTLVKDTRGTLPLSPDKTKRIYLNVIEQEVKNNTPFALNWKNRLEREGFAVTLREREMNLDPTALFAEHPSPDTLRVLGEIMASTDDFVSKYDLAMIVVNLPTVSNATTVRINWAVLAGLGNDLPWYAGEMPLVAVSTANPYHLLDIPMAHTYINAYSSNSATIDAIIDKLMGRSEFKGVSPVDPFCGHEDAKL